MEIPRHPGLYVHVPFCKRRCDYCSFISSVYGVENVSEYLAILKRDAIIASTNTGTDTRLDTIFFGGGTPSVLSDGEIVELISNITDTFKIKSDSEISFEANPDSITPRKLELLRQLGIDRLSMGAQSFDEGILDYLGRSHSPDDTFHAVEFVKSAGFENLSVDLIYGIHGQSREMWSRDIKSVLKLKPEHISIYCLSLEPDVPLYKKANSNWPDEELQAETYYLARDVFIDAGYNHYEISNFARPGYECRHNLKYWRDQEYLGLGVSAAFHWAGERYKNPEGINEYMSRIKTGRWPLTDPEPTDPEREMRTAVVLGLRLIEGIDLGSFGKRYTVNLLDYYGDVLVTLIEGGQLILEGDNLRLSPQTFFISDGVFSQLI